MFTWVCQHWRRVALSFPPFWTYIHDHHGLPNQAWIPIFLERTAKAPIDVNVHLSCHPEITIQALLPHARQIRSLRLELHSRRAIITAFKSFQVLPSLQQLQMVLRIADGSAPPVLDNWWSLDVNRQDVPRLREIFHNGIQFPWTSPCYHSLTTFAIANAPLRLTLNELLWILHACPDLEVLRIGGGAMRADDLSLHSDLNAVSLPRLRTFHIYEHLPVVTAVCNKLCGTSRCWVEISTAPIQVVPCTDTVIAAAPTHTLFRSLIPNIDVFLLTIYEDLTRFGGMGYVDYDQHIEIFLNRGDPLESLVTPGVWDAILSAFSTAPLRQAFISYTAIEEITMPMWHSFYTRFPRIEKLEVDRTTFVEYSGDEYFWAFLLSLDPIPADGNANPPLLVPLLRCIEMRYVYIDNITASRITDALEARRDAGLPLEELVLTECYCAPEISAETLKLHLQAYISLRIL